jgi:hypothetical protein
MSAIHYYLMGVLALAACGGDDSSDSTGQNPSGGAPGGSGTTPQAELTGSVTNPVTASQHGRLIVGIMPNAQFSSPISCNALVVRDERSGVSLPNVYDLHQIPLGSYLLVAVLVDPSSLTAPFAAYPISVETDGIHYKSPAATSSVDLIMQGSSSYECP